MRRTQIILTLLLAGCATTKTVCDTEIYVTGVPQITGVCADKTPIRVTCEHEGGCAFTAPCELASLTVRHAGETISRTTESYSAMPQRWCVVAR